MSILGDIGSILEDIGSTVGNAQYRFCSNADFFIINVVSLSLSEAYICVRGVSKE